MKSSITYYVDKMSINQYDNNNMTNHNMNKWEIKLLSKIFSSLTGNINQHTSKKPSIIYIKEYTLDLLIALTINNQKKKKK
jgi:hypothetical protein